ncbi:MAG: SUMF1/EgtB/PvdO family nonheme iron enzyme [Symploca sp. SIO2E6]|nr:SUMF1/EgtB/PvdO family nonheme iron enzyme [Symploca sp. SIO2E6]
MSHCINPHCPHPQNPDNVLFCQACGSELLLAGEYRVIRLLSGKGGFGRTYEVSQGSKAKVLKVLINHHNHEPKVIDLFRQEARVLQQLNHPGIPRGDGYFTFLPRNSPQPLHCLVMEKIEGSDLEEYQQQRQYRPIEQKLALKWLLQLAQILDEVHEQQFFHRDIKPSNIILKPDGQLVLIDFGTVREITATYYAKQAQGQITGVASFGYTSPEQLHHQAVPQSDFFALGRTFVFLLTGKQPIDPAIYDPRKDQLNWRPHTPDILPELADFIDLLMMRSADERPTNTQVILQRLAEIERILNPPPRRKPPKVATTVPSSGRKSTPPPPPQQPVKSANSGTSSGGLTRRKLITVAGLGGVGLVGGVIVYQTWKRKPGEINLQPFDFDVVTVDSQGKENSRNRRQANFFTEDLGDGVMLEMVAIPGGSFEMGSPATEKQRDGDEGPQHSVTIKPFYLGKFTVTQAQWRTVAALDKVSRDLNPDPSRFKGDNLPVEKVSWYDTQEFLARLSTKTGRTYRLPSEAEWEYACRADTTTTFHFGETITTDLANYNGNFTYGSGPVGEYRQKTTMAGSFQVANAFGLYDMHGNVWEWCEDHWHDNYNGAPSNGSPWLDKSENENDNHSLLLRGGSWVSNPRYCRSANRGRDNPDYRNNNIGFRVAVS